MEQYGKILIIAMPIFLLLIIIEKIYGVYKKNDTIPLIDAVSSISSGMTNSVKDVLGLSITLISYEWMVDNMAFFTLKTSITAVVIGVVAIDFYGYWSHRLAHQINFFWGKHAIHHSSEEFNLACALRQPISGFVNLFTFFLLPAALLGVPAVVIATVLPIHLFMQFWYHTKHIKNMGFLEKILVTPAHHRVHHAINPEYMDKNHSQIFIVWDKLFGTFQEELDNVPPVFGITRPAATWNPIKINFQHYFLLISDAGRAKKWQDKFMIWFKPTGWRPEGFETKYPVSKITDVYNFDKYRAKNPNELIVWATIQALISLLFVSFLFGNLAKIGFPNIFIYGLFLFLTVYSYTDLMDRNKTALFWESVRLVSGLGILYYYQDWFGMNAIIPFSNYIIIPYLIMSCFISAYFVFKNNKK